MKKYRYILIVFSLLFFSTCKKDSENLVPINTNSINETLFFGVWEIELFTMVTYDSNGNISDIDTIKYTNDLGEPATTLEEYNMNNKFYMYSPTTIDTIYRSTFLISNNTVLINLPDSLLLNFRARTISLLDSSKMEMYQNFESAVPKYRLIQKYIRR